MIKWRKIEWNLKSLDLEWTVKKQEIKNESKVNVSSKNDDFLKELLLYYIHSLAYIFYFKKTYKKKLFAFKTWNEKYLAILKWEEKEKFKTFLDNQTSIFSKYWKEHKEVFWLFNSILIWMNSWYWHLLMQTDKWLLVDAKWKKLTFWQNDYQRKTFYSLFAKTLQTITKEEFENSKYKIETWIPFEYLKPIIAKKKDIDYEDFMNWIKWYQKFVYKKNIENDLDLVYQFANELVLRKDILYSEIKRLIESEFSDSMQRYQNWENVTNDYDIKQYNFYIKNNTSNSIIKELTSQTTKKERMLELFKQFANLCFLKDLVKNYQFLYEVEKEIKLLESKSNFDKKYLDWLKNYIS